MNIFLTCLFNGLYKEYIWLHKEYEKNWSKPKRYSELTPKEIKIIINKYESGLIDGSTNKLIFKKGCLDVLCKSVSLEIELNVVKT